MWLLFLVYNKDICVNYKKGVYIIMDFSYDHKCFVCGENNPVGLKVKFIDNGNGEIEGIFTPSIFHQGFPGHLHGGLAATILDETMARAVNTLGVHGLTARLEIRYREKIPVEEEVKIIAKVVKYRKTIIDLEAEILLSDGQKAVEATGRFMVIGKMDDPEISHE